MLWTKEQRLFAVEAYFSNGRSIVATQRAFRGHFNIAARSRVPGRQSIVTWVNTLREKGSVERRRSGVERPARSAQNIEAVRQSFLRSPQRSARKHAASLGISDRSVRRILHDDLNFHPYKLAEVQEITEDTSEESSESEEEIPEEIPVEMVKEDDSSSEEIIPTEIPVEEEESQESSFEEDAAEEIPIDIVEHRIKVEPLDEEDYGAVTNTKDRTSEGGENSSAQEENEEVTHENKIEEHPIKTEPPDSEDDGDLNTKISERPIKLEPPDGEDYGDLNSKSTRRKRKADISEDSIDGDESHGKRRSDHDDRLSNLSDT